MKKTIIATTIAALLVSSAFPAFAQDAGVGVDVGAGVTAETPAVDAQLGAGANATAVADNSYASVTSSIAGSTAINLSLVTDEANVTLVLLSSLEGNAETEAAALDTALSDNAEVLVTLHSSVDANAAIKAKLEAEGFTADDVLAVSSSAEGTVTVYVDDRA